MSQTMPRENQPVVSKTDNSNHRTVSEFHSVVKFAPYFFLMLYVSSLLHSFHFLILLMSMSLFSFSLYLWWLSLMTELQYPF